MDSKYCPAFESIRLQPEQMIVRCFPLYIHTCEHQCLGICNFHRRPAVVSGLAELYEPRRAIRMQWNLIEARVVVRVNMCLLTRLATILLRSPCPGLLFKPTKIGVGTGVFERINNRHRRLKPTHGCKLLILPILVAVRDSGGAESLAFGKVTAFR